MLWSILNFESKNDLIKAGERFFEVKQVVVQTNVAINDDDDDEEDNNKEDTMVSDCMMAQFF